MGVAALIMGIVAIVLGFFGLGFPIGFICGIVGIILGAVAKKSDPTNGMATAGLVIAIVSTAISLAMYLACVACIGGTAGAIESLIR